MSINKDMGAKTLISKSQTRLDLYIKVSLCTVHRTWFVGLLEHKKGFDASFYWCTLIKICSKNRPFHQLLFYNRPVKKIMKFHELQKK